jgi:NADPH-dependent ferric siderophore reductase
VNSRVHEALNRAYPDSLLLVGRVLGERSTATGVRVVGGDADGLDLSIEEGAGGSLVRVEFPAPARSRQAFGRAVLELIATARQMSGEPGETSGERELARLRSVRTFQTVVTDVEDVHRAVRRVTLAGGDLSSFAPLGPDTFVYVMPAPSATPTGWTQRPPGAYYTVRRWRPETAELDLLVVLHDVPGVVSGWTRTCRPGDPVALWGPRDGFGPPPDTAWYLLVADDTGLPAVGAILESLPCDARVVVVAEVDGPDTGPPRPERDGVDVVWVERRGRPPGHAPELLVDALRRLDLPAGPAYVWAGAEHAAMGAVRRHVAHALGVPPERRSLAVYWSAGTVATRTARRP